MKEERMKVPKFKSLKEERELGDTHDSTDYHDDFKITKNVVFVRPKKEVISLRLEPKFIRRLRGLANKEGLPPTTYIPFPLLLIHLSMLFQWVTRSYPKILGNIHIFLKIEIISCL
jgi:predicted DNA binding CopG/RHH family protein